MFSKSCKGITCYRVAVWEDGDVGKIVDYVFEDYGCCDIVEHYLTFDTYEEFTHYYVPVYDDEDEGATIKNERIDTIADMREIDEVVLELLCKMAKHTGKKAQTFFELEDGGKKHVEVSYHKAPPVLKIDELVSVVLNTCEEQDEDLEIMSEIYVFGQPLWVYDELCACACGWLKNLDYYMFD